MSWAGRAQGQGGENDLLPIFPSELSPAELQFLESLQGGQARKPHSQVVAGTPAEAQDLVATTTVRILIPRPIAEPLSCTGVRLTPKIVLTAAHCFYSKDEPAYIHRAIVSFRDRMSNENVERVETDQIVIHPGYQGPTRASQFAQNYDRIHDLAILHLPVAPAQPMPPVRLIGRDAPLPLGTKMRVYGYGNFAEQELGDGDLWQADLSVTRIQDGLLQFKTPEGQAHRGVCFGDSGGPGWIWFARKPVLAGITSMSDFHCARASYSVDLRNNLDFIQNELSKEGR